MLRAPLVVVAALASACAARPLREPDLAATLRVQTQALLDAVSAGDRTVWQRLVADDVRYVSEDGTLETKASLIAQLAPFPAGISGTLNVVKLDVHADGDTAVVVHDDHETEQYFGQALVAEYRMVDTWRRTGDGWRLIASSVHVHGFDPPAIELPPTALDEYVGTYRLTPAVAYAIRREGNALVGQRDQRAPQTLHVELRDVLFVPGQPRSRKIFLRDAAGHITGFVDRREGHDVTWTKA